MDLRIAWQYLVSLAVKLAKTAGYSLAILALALLSLVVFTVLSVISTVGEWVFGTQGDSSN